MIPFAADLDPSGLPEGALILDRSAAYAPKAFTITYKGWNWAWIDTPHDGKYHVQLWEFDATDTRMGDGNWGDEGWLTWEEIKERTVATMVFARMAGIIEGNH